MKETTFTVKGRGGFPIDMLRYDAAFPARADDAAVIQGSLGDDPGDPVSRANREPWEVELISDLPGRSVPTVARWSSFGVTVTCINGQPTRTI